MYGCGLTLPLCPLPFLASKVSGCLPTAIHFSCSFPFPGKIVNNNQNREKKTHILNKISQIVFNSN